MSDGSTVPSPQRGKPLKSSREEAVTTGTSRIPVKQRPTQPPLHVRHTKVADGAQVNFRRGRSSSINPISSFGTPKSLTANQVTPQKRSVSTDPQLPLPVSLPSSSSSSSSSPSQPASSTRSYAPSPPPPGRQNQQQQPTPTSAGVISRFPSSSASLPASHIPRVSQTNVYKRAQSVAVTSYATAEAARLRLIERATKARLYLLHQIGPNRFLIGGDSLDSRFYVTIGSQNCTCSKPHCIHLLFVMMRVLKVGPGDPILFAKQLRNYETEGLLNALHLRNSQRTTPRKVNRRRFEFAMGSKPGSGGSGSSARPHSIVLCNTVSVDVEEEAEKTGDSQTTTESDPNVRDKVREEGDGDEGEKEEAEVVMEEEGEREEEESDKSEDEDVCPICLNELDEGEDLITCRRCGNRLHQHCMDIWAGEQIRKKELVQCPVCRTPWELTTPSPSKPSTQSFLQVSIPVGSAGGASQGAGPGGGLRLKSLSPSQQVNLSREKIVMLEKIRKVFGEMVMEGVLSSDWKSREMAVTHTSREVIPLLLPLINSGTSSTLSMSEWRDVHEASLLVVLNGCSDSVLKVFLASLELLRVVLGYTVCTTEDDSSFLQSLIKPLILTLLTRCADAQSRVKECSIDTVCHFCLGQEGPLSLGSACGKTSPFCITSLPFVVRCALKFEEKNGDAQTWHWWLGRLNFIERMIQRFSWDFLLENCTDRPPFSSDYDFEEDSISSLSLRSMGEVTPLEDEEDEEEGATREEKDQVEGEKTIKNRVPEGVKGGGGGGKVDHHLHPPPVFPARRSLSSSPHSSPPVHPASHNNLLAQAWYFAARATHVPHHKVGKVARRVIIRIAKVLRNEPSSLEIVHDVVSRCHRTAAEGLLDRVLNAREKPNSSSSQPDEEPPRKKRTEEKKETTAGGAVGKYSPFSETPRRKQSPLLQKRRMATPERSGGVSPRGGALGERRLSEYGSDDSYRSAVSDLSGDERGRGEEEERRPEGASSSGASSDSKSGDRGGATGSSSDSIIKLPKYYQRQTTVDSAFSSGSVSTEPEGSGIEVFQCKRNIEEEEAAAEAKVRSLQPEDTPHPSLYGIAPPNPETLIHVQTSRGAEATDSAAGGGGGGGEYMEGRHWVKGKLIGTGAFCSCFLARDTRIGTMMAVKQVSYARNTKTEEETELKRLQDEALMLGRLSHPNIVRCLGATQHEGHINIFIEWMAGGCLDQVLHDFGRFEESVIRNYTKQIVFGIVYLHEHGIIHRDLKGGNVLLDSTGQRIRIADFGAAARLASHTTGLGEFQDMEGTVAFMAPEVVRGGTTEEGSATGYGRKCDVWSIGCVIIQMAAAKPPWAGTYDVKNKFQLVFKIGQATEPPPIPHISDPALKDLTLRCLEVNPDDRPISSELLKHPLFTSS